MNLRAPLPVIVLIVEDDLLQRIALQELLEVHGFHAIVASDADAAVSILERRADIRIVVTDIEMPGSMDWMKLAAAVRDRWPPIEILVVSSGSAPDLGTLPARAEFMAKPLEPQGLVRTLRRMAVSDAA